MILFWHVSEDQDCLNEAYTVSPCRQVGLWVHYRFIRFDELRSPITFIVWHRHIKSTQNDAMSLC